MDKDFVFNPGFQKALLARVRDGMTLAVEMQDKIKHPGFVQRKHDNSPVTEADHAVQKMLQDFLIEHTPDWPFVGEENAHQFLQGEHQFSTFWLCDPIDGTADYAAGGQEYGINLALVVNDLPVFGLIAAPGRGDIMWTDGARSVAFVDIKNDTQLPHTDAQVTHIDAKKRHKIALSDATLIVGHGRQKDIDAFEEIIGATAAGVMRCASAVKFHALLRGEAQAYVRIRETSEWDIAAGDALVRAAGGIVFEMDRETPIAYGRPDREFKLSSVFVTLGVK